MPKETSYQLSPLRVVGHSVPRADAHANITGAALTLNFDSLKNPNWVDIPLIEAALIEQPYPMGPYGAKALGEPLLVPVTAAIANAVNDATGARIRELPISAEKILRDLRAQ